MDVQLFTPSRLRARGAWVQLPHRCELPKVCLPRIQTRRLPWLLLPDQRQQEQPCVAPGGSTTPAAGQQHLGDHPHPPAAPSTGHKPGRARRSAATQSPGDALTLPHPPLGTWAHRATRGEKYAPKRVIYSVPLLFAAKYNGKN